MSCRLQFALERVRDYDEPEMGFFGGAALHGSVVSVEV